MRLHALRSLFGGRATELAERPIDMDVLFRAVNRYGALRGKAETLMEDFWSDDQKSLRQLPGITSAASDYDVSRQEADRSLCLVLRHGNSPQSAREFINDVSNFERRANVMFAYFASVPPDRLRLVRSNQP